MSAFRLGRKFERWKIDKVQVNISGRIRKGVNEQSSQGMYDRLVNCPWTSPWGLGPELIFAQSVHSSQRHLPPSHDFPEKIRSTYTNVGNNKCKGLIEDTRLATSGGTAWEQPFDQIYCDFIWEMPSSSSSSSRMNQ